MNDMEEEIDSQQSLYSQIAYTIKQGYTCIVYITRFEMKCALNAVG